MSKSLGNLVMARDLLKDWPADALRLYLASHHYRESWSYSADALARAGQLAQKLKDATLVVGDDDGSSLEPAAARDSFVKAMDNDLDTPAALVVLEQLARDIMAAAGTGQNVQDAQKTLRRLSQVFGLRLGAPQPETRVISGWAEHLKRFVGEK